MVFYIVRWWQAQGDEIITFDSFVVGVKDLIITLSNIILQTVNYSIAEITK